MNKNVLVRDNGPETRSVTESAKVSTPHALFGTVWNNIPSITTRSLLSRISTRPSPLPRQNDTLATPMSQTGSVPDMEMVPVVNGNGA